MQYSIGNIEFAGMARCGALFPLELAAEEGRSVRANPSPKNQGFQDERSELLLFLFPLFLLFLPFLLLEVTLPPPTLPLPILLPLPRRSRAARWGSIRLSYKVPRVWGSIGIFLEHLAHSSIKAMRCSSAGAAPDIAIRGRQ
jgi:hypothetical protein